MKRQFKKPSVVAEINITPFTDVILVLLVIFMVATPLIYQSSIKVSLPELARAGAMEGAKRCVDITVTNEGVVYLGDELVTSEELRQKVTQFFRAHPALEVVLRADRMTPFKNLAGILDMLSELGIKNLNIASGTE
jgi:biopolymer transport protein ExbD